MRHNIIILIKKFLQAILYKRFFFNTSKKKKMILSFDDTIGTDIDKIFSILNKYNINATFFLTGKYISENIALVKKAHDSGHVIANHTYYHEDITKISFLQLFRTIRTTEKEIIKITGQERRLFRPPFGKLSPLTIFFCILIGYKIALWSLGGKDFDDSNWQQTTKRILSNKSEKFNDIILLHLELDRSVIALENILDQLANDGITFISFDEIL